MSRQVKMLSQQGFTLMELAVSMLVTGFLLLGLTGFVQLGMEGYSKTVNQHVLQNQGRFVVEKLTREIRHVVPNSLEVSPDGQCVSFYPIRYAGTYIVLPVSGGDPFNFVLVSAAPSTSKLNGLSLVINPQDQDELLTSSNNSAVLSNVQFLNDSSGSATSIYQADTDSNFDANNIVKSVANRLYIYKEKVEYCVTGSMLTRQEDNDAIVHVAQDLVSGSFDDGSGNSTSTLSRSNLVHMEFVFQSNDGEQSEYYDDVQVLNVP